MTSSWVWLFLAILPSLVYSQTMTDLLKRHEELTDVSKSIFPLLLVVVYLFL
jgi:hypothetical protein